MLANMGCYDLSVLRVRVCENVLNEIVAVLITRDVDKRNTWAVNPSLADPVQVSSKKFRTANLQTLLHDLRRKLVH